MMRMAVVETDGSVRTVIEIAEGSDWPVPKGCRLVADSDGEAEPGGRLGKAGFVPAPRDAAFLAGSEDNVPERNLEAEIGELKAKLAEQESALTSLSSTRT